MVLLQVEISPVEQQVRELWRIRARVSLPSKVTIRVVAMAYLVIRRLDMAFMEKAMKRITPLSMERTRTGGPALAV
jgi:hypothetical protein